MYNNNGSSSPTSFLNNSSSSSNYSLGGDGSQLLMVEMVPGGGVVEMGSPPSSLVSRHGSSHYMQRSVSSQSLERNVNGIGIGIGIGTHFASAFHEYLDLDSPCSFRRVLSTGDLEHGRRSESPLSSESSVIIESMNRATKYSPEEKKERIERYKTKRTQRNFNKKIKYECRKTLADSRPRIRGRFARNDEIDHQKNHHIDQLQWCNTTSLEEDEEDDDAWINTFLDPFSANSMV